MSYSIDGLDTGGGRDEGSNIVGKMSIPHTAAGVYEQNLATAVEWMTGKNEGAGQTIHSLTHPLILRLWQKCA